MISKTLLGKLAEYQDVIASQNKAIEVLKEENTQLLSLLIKEQDVVKEYKNYFYTHVVEIGRLKLKLKELSF